MLLGHRKSVNRVIFVAPGGLRASPKRKLRSDEASVGRAGAARISQGVQPVHRSHTDEGQERTCPGMKWELTPGSGRATRYRLRRK